MKRTTHPRARRGPRGRAYDREPVRPVPDQPLLVLQGHSLTSLNPVASSSSFDGDFGRFFSQQPHEYLTTSNYDTGHSFRQFTTKPGATYQQIRGLDSNFEERVTIRRPSNHSHVDFTSNFVIPRQAGGTHRLGGKLVKKSTKPHGTVVIKNKTTTRGHKHRRYKPIGPPKPKPPPQIVDKLVAAQVTEEWRKFYSRVQAPPKAQPREVRNWPSLDFIDINKRHAKAEELARAQKPKKPPKPPAPAAAPQSLHQEPLSPSFILSRTGQTLMHDFYLDNRVGDWNWKPEAGPNPMPEVQDTKNERIRRLVHASVPKEPIDPAWIQSIRLVGPFHSEANPLRRTEALLKLWIDAGPFSKLDILVVSARVMSSQNSSSLQDQDSESSESMSADGLPHVHVPDIQFNSFCSQLNLYVELFKKPAQAKEVKLKDYRTLWRLYGLFTTAVKSGISNYGDALSCAKAALDPSFTGEVTGNGNSRRRLCQHEKFIHQYNSALLDTLSCSASTSSSSGRQPANTNANALKAFLVTFGRFVELGKVDEFEFLAKNPLNGHIRRYFEQFSSTIPGTYTSLPRHLEAQLRPPPPPPKPVAKLKPPPPPQFAAAAVVNFRGLAAASQIKKKLHSKDQNQKTRPPPPPIQESSSSSLTTTPSPNSGSNSDIEASSAAVAFHKRKAVAETRDLRRLQRIGRSICLRFCQWKIIKRVAEESGFELVEERANWNIMWTDTPLSPERLSELRRIQDAKAIFDSRGRPSMVLQKLNHFPGMNEICRKDRLARNLKRMKKYFPKDYDFFPETWTLPTDLGKLVYHSKRKRNCTWICKPDTGSQGRGIFLVRDLRSLNPFAKLICQTYIPRPFLIDGYKFDLRIYVLITSCDPLRIYTYNEGIVRFATVKYVPPSDANLEVTFMHLTNYSLNKFSQSYVPDGSKRKLTLVLEWMRTQGHDVDRLLADIDSILVKTLISAQRTLRQFYRSFFQRLDAPQGCVCFELLGFDVLIDERMKPFVLEVNHSPSFGVDLPIDEEIKRQLVQDTLDKVYLGESGRERHRRRRAHGHGQGRQGRLDSPSYSLGLKTKDVDGSLLTSPLQKQFHHESTHGLNYRLIYPVQETYELYKAFLSHASAMDPQSTDMERSGGGGGD